MRQSRIGRELYEKFFRNYTRKQWGLDPSELDASVAGRIPVRYDRDDRYFTDTFQAMPRDGFTRMFERMLDSPNITIRTGVNYADVAKSYPGVKTIFTGPVDEYFDYRFGPLPYRSLEFKHQTFDRELYQPAAVVNFPNDQALHAHHGVQVPDGPGRAEDQRRLRVSAGRRRPVLPDPAPGKCGALRSLQGACESVRRTCISSDDWRRTSTTTWIR